MEINTKEKIPLASLEGFSESEEMTISSHGDRILDLGKEDNVIN